MIALPQKLLIPLSSANEVVIFRGAAKVQVSFLQLLSALNDEIFLPFTVSVEG